MSSSDSPIQRFTIFSLWGEKDVLIELDSPITVLIADNGAGKTTILSMIYAVLSRRLHRLRKIEFRSILVEFRNGESVEIPSEVIQPSVDISKLEPRLRRYLHRLPEGFIHHLLEETRGLSVPEFRRHPLVRELSDIAGVPPAYLFDLIRGSPTQPKLEFGEPPNQEGIRDAIAKAFPFTILYFPTYRRIEEELENLGYERKEGIRSEALIQFGMADIKARIKSVTDKIKNSSIEWYSRINGQMLSQLVDGITVDDTTRRSIQDKDTLKIVLDRIGENIGQSHKLHIMHLVDSGSIGGEKYDTLAYFLANLVKIYDQQKDLDNAIKEFTRVCNKYLVDKEVAYNESSVDIQIIQRWNKKPVDIATLSSGEKQIISLFSRLYLEPTEEVALLFDEPELSLSIEWQKMLLPDIVSSGRCKFLLATTHSPFIFENEFDKNAHDLGRFIRWNQ